MIAQSHLLDKIVRLIDNGSVRHVMTKHFGLLTAETLRQARAKVESGGWY